jgi:hypothetical protein
MQVRARGALDNRIELEVFRGLKKGPEWDNFGLGLRKWLTLLAEGDKLDPEDLPVVMADGDVREALEIKASFTLQDRERYLYERRQDFEWSRNAEMAEATGLSMTEIEEL